MNWVQFFLIILTNFLFVLKINLFLINLIFVELIALNAIKGKGTNQHNLQKKIRSLYTT